MGEHTLSLWTLASEVLELHQLTQLQVLTSKPFDYAELCEFDRLLGGPSLTTVQTKAARQVIGQYSLEDRDVFRPLQYCAMYFEHAAGEPDLEWRTRGIIQMSSLHLESLITRIGGIRGLPLGQVLRSRLAKSRIDPITWQLVNRFTKVYNDSKHRADQPKDTHLFSIPDAVVAYVVCRKLAMNLYALATIRTDWRSFGK